MTPRARRPTMAEVARAAGVSVMTVSYAYSQPDRVSAAAAESVRAAAAELGYPGPHPAARSLRRGSAGSLGVVLGERLPYAFDDPQASRFLAGVAATCAAEAVSLTLVPTTGRDSDVARVADAAVDGFVIWTTSDDDPVLDAVAATGLPAVIPAGPHRSRVPVVGIDDRAAAAAVGPAGFAGARRPPGLSFPPDPDRPPQPLRRRSAGRPSRARAGPRCSASPETETAAGSCCADALRRAFAFRSLAIAGTASPTRGRASAARSTSCESRSARTTAPRTARRS